MLGDAMTDTLTPNERSRRMSRIRGTETPIYVGKKDEESKAGIERREEGAEAAAGDQTLEKGENE